MSERDAEGGGEAEKGERGAGGDEAAALEELGDAVTGAALAGLDGLVRAEVLHVFHEGVDGGITAVGINLGGAGDDGGDVGRG